MRNLGDPAVQPISFMFHLGRNRSHYVRCSLRPLELRVSILIGRLVYPSDQVSCISVVSCVDMSDCVSWALRETITAHAELD